MIGVHPQTFGVPPPPHVCGALHCPQLNVPLQPFEIVPQSLPCFTQVVGVHPHTLGTPPPPHVSQELGHAVGQLTIPPHPSLTLPQRPLHDVSGVHGAGPHLPPVQCELCWHVPQKYVPPHPSGCIPHSTPWSLQDFATQVHFELTHVRFAAHEPQSRVRLHPSSIVPHVAPRVGHTLPVHVHRPEMHGPDEHVPQSSVPPHPSSCNPQEKPRS